MMNKKQALKMIETSQTAQCVKDFPAEFQNDKEIILYAVSFLKPNNNLANISTIGDDLKNNKEFWLEALQYNPYIFSSASDEMKSDCNLVRKVLEKLGHEIDYPYSNTRELLEPHLKKSSIFFKFANEEIKNDRELVLQALKRRVSNIRYASDEIKDMLQGDAKDYISKLEKIMEIEALHQTLGNSLEKVHQNLPVKHLKI